MSQRETAITEFLDSLQYSDDPETAKAERKEAADLIYDNAEIMKVQTVGGVRYLITGEKSGEYNGARWRTFYEYYILPFGQEARYVIDTYVKVGRGGYYGEYSSITAAIKGEF